MKESSELITQMRYLCSGVPPDFIILIFHVHRKINLIF